MTNGTGQQRAMIEVDQSKQGLIFKTFDEAYRYAEAVVVGKIAPQGDSAAAVLVKMQAGWELGITPMRALQNLVVFNGRLSMMEKLASALVRSSGKVAKGGQLKVWFTGDEDPETGTLANNYTCHVTSKRVDEDEPNETTFSVLDAKIARLWGKQQTAGVSPWVASPKRMLMARAKQHHIQDYYSDVTLGIATYETVVDDLPINSRATLASGQAVRGPLPEQPTGEPTGEADPLFDAVDAVVVEPETTEPTETPEPATTADDGSVEE